MRCRPRAAGLALALLAAFVASRAAASPVTYTVTLQGPVPTTFIAGCNGYPFGSLWGYPCPVGWDAFPPATTGLPLVLPLAGSYSVTLDAAAGTASLVDLGIVAAPGNTLETPIAEAVDLANLVGVTTPTGAVFSILDPGYGSTGFATLQLTLSGSTAVLTGHYFYSNFHSPVWLVRFEGTAVPEPASALLVAAGLVGLALRRRAGTASLHGGGGA